MRGGAGMKAVTTISLDPELLTTARARCKQYGLSLSGVVSELLAGFCELDDALLVTAAEQFRRYDLRPAEVIAVLLTAFCKEGENGNAPV